MNCETSARTVLVSLPITFVEALLHMRSAFDDEIASAVGESVRRTPASTTTLSDQPILDAVIPARGKYAAEFLGVAFFANSLAAVFGRVVDMMAEVAPEALVSLAAIRTRGRRFVSREPRDIHPHSPHLPVMQTESGWWISKNISQGQLKQALRTLCRVSDLSFGKDLKFPLRQPFRQS